MTEERVMRNFAGRAMSALASLVVLAACAGGPVAGSSPAGGPDSPGAPPAAAALQTAAFERRIWAHEASDITPDPAVRYGRLANGLAYAIMKNATPSRAASIRLRFGVGSVMEADDQRGLAHFLEHMAFNGSENVPEGEMIKLLERYGLSFGPDTNAYTSFLETVYQLDLPDARDEVVDAALMIMRETGGRLTLSPAAIDRERGVILSEKRVRDTPAFRAFLARFAFLYPQATASRRMPIGAQEVITGAPREAFERLYRGWYRPDNALLVVTGDVDPGLMEARIAARFADWRAPDAPLGRPALGRVEPRGLEAGYVQDPAIPTTLTISSLAPFRFEPDTAENRRRAFVRALGFSILSRRFSTLSRQPGASFLSASASWGQTFDVAQGGSVAIVSRPESWRAALGVAEQELRRALTHGFTQAELAEQIANARTSLKNAADGATTRQTRALADALAGGFDDRSVFSTPQDDLSRFDAFAGAITPGDVLTAFREAWGEGPPLLFLSTSAVLANAPAEILTAWRESSLTGVAAPAAVAEASFAYDDFGPPGPVVSRSEAADLGVTHARFANGVMLNVKRTAFDRDSVSITARFGDGLRALPKTQPGLGLWISNAFVNAGLGRHSIDELQRVLAGRAWSLDLDMGDDAFSLNAVVPPADLALQLQLMAALASDPGYRPEAFEQFAQAIAVWYPTLESTPQGVLGRDLGRILHDGDPRWGVPALAEIQSRTPAEIRAVLTDAMLRGPMEISIVGDVDVDAAIGAAARTLGALPARTGVFDLSRNAAGVRFPAPPGAPIVLTHAGDADKAAVSVSWPGIDESDLRQARVLRLMRDVFDVKMTDEVRERLGATYSPGVTASASDVFKGYGFVQATVDARASDVEAVVSAIGEVASRMRAGEISADEFERARKPLLEQINQRFERNGYWLDVLSQSQSRPGWLDRTRTIKQDYAGITLDDVKALAARIFVPEKAVTVKVLSGAPPAGPQTDAARQAGQ